LLKNQRKEGPKIKPVLVLSRPPKPYNEMNTKELDEYCGQVYEAIMGKKSPD
jgi:hypothetical protein